MAAQYKTRCPHCGAQFRISEEHLKQARGKVRCGSCLEVFLATRNLVDEQGNPIKPRGQQPQSSQQPSSGQQARSTQSQQRRPQQGDRQGEPAQQKPPQPQTRQGATGGQQSASKPAPAGGGPEDWKLPGQNQQQADTPDSERSDEDGKKDYIPSNDTAVSLGSSEFSDSFLNLEEEGDDSDHDFSEIGGGGDTDESWAEQLLEELEEEESSSKDRGKPAADPPSPESMSLLDEWNEDEEEPAETTAEPAGSGIGLTEEEDTDEFDLFRADAAADDEDTLDFVEIEAPEEKPARKLTLPARPSLGVQWLKWAALSVLALAVLGGQYLTFNFSELARQPDWRPLYVQVCGVVGCQLPQRANIGKLRGANLVVRSHPRVANALVVDAIIFNEANYPQPFPQLELTFSSLEEEPVASRRFQPSEYRAGELAELEHMPPGVPIHVSFEILDPGPEAVNYSLSFHPPAADHPGSDTADAERTGSGAS